MTSEYNRLIFCGVVVITALLTASCAGKKTFPEEKEMEAFQALHADVREVVTDSTRAEQMVALVGELQQEFDAINRAKRLERYRALHLDYDASRAEIEVLLDGFMQERLVSYERVTQTYRKMRDAVTAEEWIALSKSSNKAMDAALQAMQSF